MMLISLAEVSRYFCRTDNRAAAVWVNFCEHTRVNCRERQGGFLFRPRAVRWTKKSPPSERRATGNLCEREAPGRERRFHLIVVPSGQCRHRRKPAPSMSSLNLARREHVVQRCECISVARRA